MFIQPWDAAVHAAEWREWLASTDRFGILVANNCDPAQAPVVVPTHVTLAEDGAEILLHLARPNPIWPHLEAAEQVRLVFTGDYAYIPGHWRAGEDKPEAHGVPTSYYSAVQFVCRPVVSDDPAVKAEVLRAQLADFQPEGRHVAPDEEPYQRMLPGIRAVRLLIVAVEAKFKYDDHKPTALRTEISTKLIHRGRPADAGAAAQQRRRLDLAGDWETRRGR